MSRIQVTVLVCDRCGLRSDDSTDYKPIKIAGSGFDGEYDLCSNCIVTFSEAIGMGGELPRPKTRTRRGSTIPTERARKEWSADEDEHIRNNLKAPNHEIAELLGRSEKAVALRKRRIAAREKSMTH